MKQASSSSTVHAGGKRLSANVHSHHFNIRATQFSPELQVSLAALGQGNGRPVDLGLSRGLMRSVDA
jgi:hypothetical protein